MIAAIISALCGGLATLIPILCSAFQHVSPKPTVVGIGNIDVPEALAKYPDYTDIHKCRRSKSPVVIFHYKNLSYALKHCDFVCADVNNCDPKIHRPDSPLWESLV